MFCNWFSLDVRQRDPLDNSHPGMLARGRVTRPVPRTPKGLSMEIGVYTFVENTPTRQPETWPGAAVS